MRAAPADEVVVATNGLAALEALAQLLPGPFCERGLAENAMEAARDELEAVLASSARELEQTRARLAAAEGRLAAAAEQEERTKNTLRALAERARHELGQCLQCRKPVRGYDYLVSGRCPHCGRALTALLTPRAQVGAPERDEYLALDRKSVV